MAQIQNHQIFEHSNRRGDRACFSRARVKSTIQPEAFEYQRRSQDRTHRVGLHQEAVKGRNTNASPCKPSLDRSSLDTRPRSFRWTPTQADRSGLLSIQPRFRRQRGPPLDQNNASRASRSRSSRHRPLFDHGATTMIHLPTIFRAKKIEGMGDTRSEGYNSNRQRKSWNVGMKKLVSLPYRVDMRKCVWLPSLRRSSTSLPFVLLSLSCFSSFRGI